MLDTEAPFFSRSENIVFLFNASQSVSMTFIRRLCTIFIVRILYNELLPVFLTCPKNRL